MNFRSIIGILVVFTAFTFGQDKIGVNELRPGYYQVRVDNFSESNEVRVRIWGEIKNPGIYLVPEHVTLIDILAIAGGPTESADLSQIIVNSMQKDRADKNIIDLEYFFETGKFEIKPVIADETVIIISKSKKQKFFDSLPKILNVLNIISITVVLVNWLS